MAPATPYAIESYEKLRSMSEEDLIEMYDRVAPATVLPVTFLRDELARREMEKQQENMLALTKQMRNLTIVIAVLTVINVIVVLKSFL